MFDDREPDTPKKSQADAHPPGPKKPQYLLFLCFFGPEDQASENTQHDRAGKSQAAQEPSVSRPILEWALDVFIQIYGQIPLGGQLPGTVSGNRHPDHQRPEQQQQPCGYPDLPFDFEIQENDRTDQITGGDGLKGVAVDVQFRKVIAQQMPLGDHAQDEQDKKTDDDMRVEFFAAIPSRQPFGKGKGHGHSHDKKKKGHDQIPEPESFPLDMPELAIDEFRDRAVEYGMKIPEYPRSSDDPEHVESPKGIQRFQSFSDSSRPFLQLHDPILL